VETGEHQQAIESSAGCVEDAGTRRYPPSWGRSNKLAGKRGFWVGRSGRCFTAEL
jgi:hypothetical protein